MSFGSGSNGRLGHGDDADQSTPKAVAGLGTNVQACSAGDLCTALILIQALCVTRYRARLCLPVSAFYSIAQCVCFGARRV
jgi:hypothetical protein